MFDLNNMQDDPESSQIQVQTISFLLVSLTD